MTDLIQTFLFLAFSLIAVLPIFPIRLSILAFLLISHVGFSRGGLGSTGDIGIENAVRLILLPTVLMLRTRLAGLRMVQSRTSFLAWGAAFAYTAIASLWSPFPISAIKQLGYFYSYTSTVLILFWYFENHEKDARKTMLWFALITVGLTVLATIVRSIELNTSLFGTRLTSFTPEQSFGMSLPLLAAITLITQVKDRIRYRQIFWIIFTILLLFAAAILNGSRTGLFASIILAFSLIIWPFISKHRRAVGLAYFSLTGIVSLALLFLIFLPTEQVKAALSSNRALLGIAVLLDSNASITDLGTAQFRVSMYQTAITNYLEKPAVYKVIGSGTSSAATLITEGHIRYRGYTSETVDANRVVHNEFLRILYEWGIVGAVLWGFAFLTIAYKLGKVASRMQILGNYVLLVSFMLIFLFLMVENVISSSGTLEGTTISILLAILLHHPDRWGQL